MEMEGEGIRNNTFKELVMYSRLILNRNNEEFWRKQILKDTLKNFTSQTKCYQVLNNFMRYFYQLPLLQQNNIILKSGLVLFVYGIRKCGDVDLEYINEIDLPSKKSGFDIVEIKADEQETYYPNGKTAIKASEYIVNPRYHFYFYGMKFLTLDMEMRKRAKRINRPRAFVDIIMVNEILGTKYKLPPLDMKSNKFPLTSMEKFYKTLRSNFKNRYQKIYSDEDIKNLLNKYR